MKRLDWFLVALCAVAFACTCVGVKKARAHNPITHVADKLSEATSRMYGSCCIGDEYLILRTEEWEPTEDGWRVKYKGQWLKVPRLAQVDNMPNPDGIAKVWVFGSGDTTYVRCFMAGTLG